MALAAAAGTQGTASHAGQPAPRPVAALRVGGPHSAPWRGAGERQPCCSLRPPLAAEASRAWGSAGGGREQSSLPNAKRGKARRGTRVVFKVSGNPSAAGGCWRGCAQLSGAPASLHLSSPEILTQALTLLWPPQHPEGIALGCAGWGSGGWEVGGLLVPGLGRAWPRGSLHHEGPAPAARPETWAAWVREAPPPVSGTRRAELCWAGATFLPCGSAPGAAPGLPERAGNQCGVWFRT